MVIAMIKIRTKKVLKPVNVEPLFDKLVVEGINLSKVVSLGILSVYAGTKAGIGVDCSIDVSGVIEGIIDWEVVVVGVCVSAEGTAVDVFILGGVGGVGLIGGVGDCISKPPFR